jgi:hypothetical protein
MQLRDPKEITVTDGDGKEHKFIISKIPAWDAMEINTRLPPALAMLAIPKIGDYAVVQELQLKIMKYVGVDKGGNEPLRLTTRELIDNHAPDWEVFRKLLEAEVTYNNSFFRNGGLSRFLADVGQMSRTKITEMLREFSEQSSQKSKQP